MDEAAKSLTAEAFRALGRGDVPAARTFIAQAFAADRKVSAVADAVHLACAEIENDGGVSTATWNTLADAVDTGELFGVVEESRSS